MAYENHRLGKKPYRIGDLVGYQYGETIRIAFVKGFEAHRIKVERLDGIIERLRDYRVRDLSSYPPFMVSDIVVSLRPDWSTWPEGIKRRILNTWFNPMHKAWVVEVRSCYGSSNYMVHTANKANIGKTYMKSMDMEN